MGNFVYNYFNLLEDFVCFDWLFLDIKVVTSLYFYVNVVSKNMCVLLFAFAK